MKTRLTYEWQRFGALASNGAILLLLCTFGSAANLAVGEGIPKLNDYLAMEKAEDCSLMRELVGRAQQQLKSNQVERRSNTEVAKNRRAELLSCALAHGMTALKREPDLAAAAEVCPEAYQAWLVPSYMNRISEKDDYATAETIRKLTWQLQMNCRLVKTVRTSMNEKIE